MSEFSAVPYSTNDLIRYGWDETRQSEFTTHASYGLVPARIVRVDRGQCEAMTSTGAVHADTTPFTTTNPDLSPCTGDWAALRTIGIGHTARLEALLPRRGVIVRSSSARSSQPQVLATNVDTVVITVSLTTTITPGRVERLLALAWESGAVPVIVLTKADRCTQADVQFAQAEVKALALGVDVLVISATNGMGMDALAAALTGTVVLLGPSGAGKSTLGNALLGADLLATGEVRGDGKGRHITVQRELVPRPSGGVLIDTPGLRGIGLQDADDGLRQAFAEIEKLAENCRFADCAHATEPGCAVLAAIEVDELPQRRLDSYRKLMRENAWAASRTDARVRAERAKQSKAFSRWVRDYTSPKRQG